jgi:hypothetical protein
VSESRFRVIFERLPQAEEAKEPGSDLLWIGREELDEIAELRRLALEISEPEPQS